MGAGAGHPLRARQFKFALVTGSRPAHDPRMVEYGNGVSQSTGIAGGSGGGGQMDAGAAFGQFISNSIHTISSLPPSTLIIGAVVIVLGLIFLKRAF
jgi:hypothetical protein